MQDPVALIRWYSEFGGGIDSGPSTVDEVDKVWSGGLEGKLGGVTPSNPDTGAKKEKIKRSKSEAQRDQEDEEGASEVHPTNTEGGEDDTNPIRWKSEFHRVLCRVCEKGGGTDQGRLQEGQL